MKKALQKLVLVAMFAGACGIAAASEKADPPIPLAPPPMPRVNFTDIWTGADSGGWGINFVQSGDFIFATLSGYDENGKPAWYSGEMRWSQKDADRWRYAFTGPLYTSTSTMPVDGFLPKAVKTVPVGNVSFSPDSVTTGALEVVLRERKIEIPIRRLTLTAPLLTTGGFMSAMTVSETTCQEFMCVEYSSSYNAPTFFSLEYVFGTNGTEEKGRFDFTNDEGVSCRISGTLTVNGPFYEIRDGAYRCSKNGASTLDTTATLLMRFSASGGMEGSWKSREKDGYSEESIFSAVLSSPAE